MTKETVRLFLLTVGLYLLTVTLAHAASSGAEMSEFTGFAEQILGAIRFQNFVKFVAVAVFAFGIFEMYTGRMGGAFGGVIMMLLAVGGWLGAESIIDSAQAASGVIF